MEARTPHLYEMTASLAPLRRAVDLAEVDEDGVVDVPPDLLDALNAIEAPYEAKLLDCERYARSLEAEAAPIEARAQAFREEAERIERASMRLLRDAERVRATVIRSMVATGTKAVAGDGIALQTKLGSERVEVTDLAAVPTEFRRAPVLPPPQEWAVDKKSAAAALKCGDHVPGLSLVRGPTTLVVK